MNALFKLARRGFVLAAFWIPTAVCLMLAWTPDPKGITENASGTLAHIVAFCYLSTALFHAHFNDPGHGAARVLAVALWMLALGVVVEVVQLLFVSGRSGDLGDLGVDAVGIAAGCATYFGLVAIAGKRARGARGKALTTTRTLVGS